MLCGESPASNHRPQVGKVVSPPQGAHMFLQEGPVCRLGVLATARKGFPNKG